MKSLEQIEFDNQIAEEERNRKYNLCLRKYRTLSAKGIIEIIRTSPSHRIEHDAAVAALCEWVEAHTTNEG